MFCQPKMIHCFIKAKGSEKRRGRGFKDSRGRVEKNRSQKTEVRKQKAEGRRLEGWQKTEGRSQKTEGRRLEG